MISNQFNFVFSLSCGYGNKSGTNKNKKSTGLKSFWCEIHFQVQYIQTIFVHHSSVKLVKPWSLAICGNKQWTSQLWVVQNYLSSSYWLWWNSFPTQLLCSVKLLKYCNSKSSFLPSYGDFVSSAHGTLSITKDIW